MIRLRRKSHLVMLYYRNMGDNRIRGETDAGSMFGFHFYVGKDARLSPSGGFFFFVDLSGSC